ncbi:hypothetical protein PR048_007838 [Dryococelus australis]|uniref:Uncharacterized protein n=1 Tax=Dryococelus australis TaxID=614101 RepID=A0ABQ9HVD8_9NEOP|nr:hypothetical protein PR048_007838 [Dryococelus australis]
MVATLTDAQPTTTEHDVFSRRYDVSRSLNRYKSILVRSAERGTGPSPSNPKMSRCVAEKLAHRQCEMGWRTIVLEPRVAADTHKYLFHEFKQCSAEEAKVSAQRRLIPGSARQPVAGGCGNPPDNGRYADLKAVHDKVIAFEAFLLGTILYFCKRRRVPAAVCTCVHSKLRDTQANGGWRDMRSAPVDRQPGNPSDRQAAQSAACSTAVDQFAFVPCNLSCTPVHTAADTRRRLPKPVPRGLAVLPKTHISSPTSLKNGRGATECSGEGNGKTTRKPTCPRRIPRATKYGFRSAVNRTPSDDEVIAESHEVIYLPPCLARDSNPEPLSHRRLAHEPITPRLARLSNRFAGDLQRPGNFADSFGNRLDSTVLCVLEHQLQCFIGCCSSWTTGQVFRKVGSSRARAINILHALHWRSRSGALISREKEKGTVCRLGRKSELWEESCQDDISAPSGKTSRRANVAKTAAVFVTKRDYVHIAAFRSRNMAVFGFELGAFRSAHFTVNSLRIRTLPLSNAGGSLRSLAYSASWRAVIILFGSRQGEPVSISGGVAPGFPRVGIVPADAAGRRIFSGISRFLPPFHFGAVSYSSRFSLIGSHDRDIQRPNHPQNYI